MQISFPNIKNTFNISKVSSKRTSFRGINNNLQTDTFTRSASDIRTVGLCDGTVTGKFVKNVMFDDRKGNKVPGFIIENIDKRNEYFACVNGNAECRMLIDDDDGFIYVAHLYGQNNQGSVKGAGTELIKTAVEISKEKGYGGKLQLKMGGSFPFHYKNNFRATRYNDSDEMNAALDYATRTGCAFTKVWPEWNVNRLVELDEKGAEMLLNGERLIDKSKSQTLYSAKIEGNNGKIKEFDMDFCDFEDKFIIQMIDKNANAFAQAVVMKGEIKDGRLIPDEELIDNKGFGELESVQNEFANALKLAQQKLSE